MRKPTLEKILTNVISVENVLHKLANCRFIREYIQEKNLICANSVASVLPSRVP